MRTSIAGGTLLTPERQLADHTLILTDGKIARIQAGAYPPKESSEHWIDARGLWVVPGLIDLHVHGGAGHDTMDATAEAWGAMSRFQARQGVTAYLPTTVSAAPQAIQEVLKQAGRFVRPGGGSRPLGVHLEGPYLNAEFAGAQPREAVRDPDPDEYLAWLASGQIRMITLAPELPGVDSLLAAAVRQGVIVAAGHTGADLEAMRDAADRGLHQITHLLNSMPGLHHRMPGPVGAALLDDRFIVHLIVDGVHLHPAIVDLVVRIKGPDRTVLISDSMRATGLEDGSYELGGQEVRVAGRVARTVNGALAGSTLTLIEGLRNAIEFTGLALQRALPMVTRTPAQVLGEADRRGVLRPGTAADITLLDRDLRVRGTLVAGELVYQSEALPTDINP